MLIPMKKIAINKKPTTKEVTKPLNMEILLRLTCLKLICYYSNCTLKYFLMF